MHTDVGCRVGLFLTSLFPESDRQTPLSRPGQHTRCTRCYSTSRRANEDTAPSGFHGNVNQEETLFISEPFNKISTRSTQTFTCLIKPRERPSASKSDRDFVGSGNEIFSPYEPLVYIAENVTLDQWSTNIARTPTGNERSASVSEDWVRKAVCRQPRLARSVALGLSLAAFPIHVLKCNYITGGDRSAHAHNY